MESDDSLTPEEDIYEEEEDFAPKNIARFSDRKLPTSPSEEFWAQTVSPTLERRMDKHIYQNGKYCLIENTVDSALHYVHCLSRRVDPRRLNDLEFAWDLQRGTLNLDTRSNVFCLSAKFKALWEDYKWILVPEDRILELYCTGQENDRKLPDVGAGPYKYRLFAHPDMRSVPIHRQLNFSEKKNEGPKPNHFTFSAYPFKNLGMLTSHIHPKFAICHMVATPTTLATQLTSDYSLADPTAQNVLRRCTEIIDIWSPFVEDVASKHTGFLESQVTPYDIHSETSDRTANCRLRPHLSDQRLIEEQGYVHVKEDDGVVRLRPKEDAPHLLTAKKLQLFEFKTLAHQTTVPRWKAIQSWRATVSGGEQEQEQITHSLSEDDNMTFPSESEN